MKYDIISYTLSVSLRSLYIHLIKLALNTNHNTPWQNYAQQTQALTQCCSNVGPPSSTSAQH